MTVDAQQCWKETVNDMDIPDYNIIYAHIEPNDIKVPSGQDLDPEAVIAARRREVQN